MDMDLCIDMEITIIILIILSNKLYKYEIFKEIFNYYIYLYNTNYWFLITSLYKNRFCT